MQDSNLLFEILLLLALTATGLALFERLKLPAIAGFLVVGAIAGPGVLGLVGEPDRVRVLAEVGRLSRTGAPVCRLCHNR